MHKFRSEEEQKRQRINDLSTEVEKLRNELPALEEKYKKAVADDLKTITDIFNELEAHKNKLKAEEHRLKTLQEVTQEHLKENARQTILNYPKDVQTHYEQDVAKLDTKIAKLREKYIAEVGALLNLKEDRYKQHDKNTQQYRQLMHQYQLTSDDLGKQLYTRLDNPPLKRQGVSAKVGKYDIIEGRK